MEEIETLTEFIAIWFNHIIALMFLLTSLIMFALPRTLRTSVFYVSFFVIFGFWEIMTYRRKKEFQNEK